MRDTFPCPLCGVNDWVNGKKYVLRRDWADTESRRAYYRVLLDVWFPSQPEVTLQDVSCTRCGFIAYSPRPDEEDIVEKHKDPDLLAPNPRPTRLGAYMDERRALRGYRAATRHLERPGKSVLDIGGGDGKLLTPFVRKGFDSYVIDYYDHAPIDGVTRLGPTIGDLPPDRQFDVILCNHLLEHILDPLGFLKGLTNHVTAGGVLHVEVPDEVWAGLPLPLHASFHLNYFTKKTTEILLKLSGWRPIWSRTRAGSYAEVAIAVTDIVAQAADRPLPVSDAEYAAASRDSQMRLHADSKLRREHFQVLAGRVMLQADSMVREGHVVANTRGVMNRAVQAVSKRR